jgi:hypothetical protein
MTSPHPWVPMPNPNNVSVAPITPTIPMRVTRLASSPPWSLSPTNRAPNVALSQYFSSPVAIETISGMAITAKTPSALLRLMLLQSGANTFDNRFVSSLAAVGDVPEASTRGPSLLSAATLQPSERARNLPEASALDDQELLTRPARSRSVPSSIAAACTSPWFCRASRSRATTTSGMLGG